MEDVVQQIRHVLSRSCLFIRKDAFMFDSIDSFVAMSRENTSVTIVKLYPFDSDAGDYEFWDKVGQIVGNLMKLKTLCISFRPYIESDDALPDWETLSRILPYLRRKVELLSSIENYDVDADEIQGFARVIHGHPMISAFSSKMDLTLATLGPWCSLLATFPSLESVELCLTEDQLELVNVEPFRELLRAPALRFVTFSGFHFTNALCHATATALEEGSSINDIQFGIECTFPDGGRAIVANALKRNTSVTNVEFLDVCDEPLCNTLAVVLLHNSTLQNLTLTLSVGGGGILFSSILLSLGMNTTLKSLDAYISDRFGDELCAAITSGLTKNTTLENLTLTGMLPRDDDGAASARNALSFLRTNTTLKSLTVFFVVPDRNGSYTSAFRLEAVKMMEDNPCLESLSITSNNKIKLDELLEVLSALQLNTTLKTLGFEYYNRSIYFSDDEVNQLVSILRNNYGLERLSEISCADDRTVKATLKLNGAGRRYLIEDGSSILKGVDVLSAVRDDINCVFLHLLENPGLCDRRIVDATTTSQRPGTKLDESSSSGKRERAQSQPGKEPRRRLS
jgi:hypothetical protein